ncbi:hypothetical protein EJB05_21131 [Eragrostis curvula]|uniref:Major facilitator superfamily (MFS) profile domain-containing protein n=1 Tax=Eragrostis curvula TaxID=38414 RepID=A0A5J9V0C4_9POAL|nr:hypothetical protein EJB05_21131 [Eragrostis curvula]
MQSSAMAFVPSIATAKLELHSLFRKYVDMFGISSNDSTFDCHVTRKMPHLPVQLIDRTFFSTGAAFRSIAISYGALILRWLLNRTPAVQRTLISRTIRSLCCWCGSLPFFVSIGLFLSRIYNNVMFHSHIYGRQFIFGHNANLQGESTMDMENSELCNMNNLLSSLFGNKKETVRLALQCICYPASLKVADITEKKLRFNRLHARSSYAKGALWRIISQNEQYVVSMMVLVALQLFLRLTRVNVTPLFFPMLSRATSSKSSVAVIGNIVLVLVNSFGVLGSALVTKQYGREVTFSIGAVLMVFCQVAIPVILEVQIGVGGGTRMPTGYATAMFALTCVVSCGLSWSWGSFIWAVPSWKVPSAGQVVSMTLNFGFCFAQMQFFLLMLCRLKNAILAYYAMWIWS